MIERQLNEHELRCRGDLTRRQKEIAGLVGRAMSNREIADSLGLDTGTVKVNVTYILAKLNLKNRVELALSVHGINLRQGAAA